MPSPGTFTPGYNAQSGRFFTILFGNVPVGGLQNVRYTETFGTHWVPEVGSDHKEPEFGMRQVQGTFERLAINTAKLRDLLAGLPNTSSSNVDLRNYQFTLTNSYAEQYLTATNDVQGGTASSKGSPIVETIYGVMFSDLGFNLNDATSLAREYGTFIGKSVNTNNDPSAV